MALEIVGCKKKVRSNQMTMEYKLRQDKRKIQVPCCFWAKFVTLQGNLINMPFAVGMVNMFVPVDRF